jgi:hypothetical protein
MTTGQGQPEKSNNSYKNGKHIYQKASELIQSLFPEVDGEPKLSEAECQLIITCFSMALDISKTELCKKIYEYSIQRKINKHDADQRFMMIRLRKLLPSIDFE